MLRQLRDTWAGLTLKDAVARQPAGRTPRLRIQTISDYERGLRLPDWAWVYEYVTVCLTQPKPPRRALVAHQLDTERNHWQQAWVSAKEQALTEPETTPPAESADTEPENPAAETPDDAGGTESAVAPAGPEGQADHTTDDLTGLEAASTPHADQPQSTATATDTAATEGSQPSGLNHRTPAGQHRRRLAGVAAAAAALVVVGVVTVALLSNNAAGTEADPAAAAPAPTTAPSPTPESVPVTAEPAAMRDGPPVDDLAPQEAYDFDYDLRQPDEDAPGMDLSANRGNYVINSVATDLGGRLVRLPPGTTRDRAACDAIPTEQWTKNVPGMPIGGSICLRTDEQNLVILTITKAWASPTDNTISFRYRIWHQ